MSSYSMFGQEHVVAHTPDPGIPNWETVRFVSPREFYATRGPGPLPTITPTYAQIEAPGARTRAQMAVDSVIADLAIASRTGRLSANGKRFLASFLAQPLDWQKGIVGFTMYGVS